MNVVLNIKLEADPDRQYCWSWQVAGFDAQDHDQIVYRDSFLIRAITEQDVVDSVSWVFDQIWEHVTPMRVEVDGTDGGPLNQAAMVRNFVIHILQVQARDTQAIRVKHQLLMAGLSPLSRN